MGDSNRWAESYPADYSAKVQTFGLPHDWFVGGKAKWLKRFLDRHDLRPIETLDIGCGIGLLHQHLGPWAGNVTGCDVSDTALKQAAIRNRDVDYHLYDGIRLPFADHSFECCLAVTVLHHVPVAAWRDFATEAARVLRPGGVFVIIEHNPWNPLTRLSVAKSDLDHDAVLLTARTCKRLLGDMRGVRSESLFLTAQYAAYGFR